ncbi:hypothetical protein R1V99_00310, partial [Stenotrophomonas maltophilia]|nr:hypothetical protein [Stenotrophomonas maltophilia]
LRVRHRDTGTRKQLDTDSIPAGRQHERGGMLLPVRSSCLLTDCMSLVRWCRRCDQNQNIGTKLKQRSALRTRLRPSDDRPGGSDVGRNFFMHDYITARRSERTE